ncbi:MAG: sulfite exporter TauE/SafE family protein [Planctomycetota bacterium]|jgi:uncharacterized membrane protein YfcA
MDVPEATLLFFAAAAAGAVNAVAGGGTLLSFPALLFTGMDAKLANATSATALWPGQWGGALGYRKDLKGGKPFLIKLGIPSVLGGITGAVILWKMPGADFDALVPWLILFATLLFAAAGPLSAALRKGAAAVERAPGFVGVIFQFLVSVYGGFFGAGAGILMLAAMTFMHMTDIHRMNGLKMVLAALINGVAVAIFVALGYVQWSQALLMAVGATLGGYGMARVARKVSKDVIKVVVILIGLTVAGVRFWQQYS